MTQVVQHHAPAFSKTAARDLIALLYDIRGELRPLPSERDQNFACFTASGEAYVLKIANGAEDETMLRCQNEAMNRVARATGKAPTVVSTADGRMIAGVDGPDGRRHFVRLVTYLPGNPLASVRPQSAELLEGVGQLLGQVAGALAGFDDPALHRDFDWDLRNGSRIVAEYESLLSPERQRVAARFLARFMQEAAPRLAELRTGVIHGDGNDYNILVKREGWRMTPGGLIDFGDMVHSWIAGEAAIAAAYAMLDKADPLTAAAAVARGFHAAYPLTEPEAELLYDLILLRLTMSMVMAARQQAAAPDNDYLGISQAPVWRLLQQLEKLPPGLARAQLRQACGFAPAPAHGRVATWLAGRLDALHPVVDGDLRTPDQLVLDLSVASPLFAVHPATLTPGALDNLIRQEMAMHGKTTAIGRYDEARLLYSADAFADATDELPERRTVHLGIDLFQPPGSPVYAPLAGTVHSVADNGDRQDYGPTLILAHETDDGTPFYTLYGHLSRTSLSGLTPGQPIAGGAKIGCIGAMEENGGWPPHLHLQLMVDLLGLDGDFPGVAAPRNRALWKALCPDPNLLLGIPAQCFPRAERAPEEILRARRAQLGRNLSISYRKPVKIVRGWRQYLYDHEGRAYLDGVNNVSHVGHGHPRVVGAGQRQMQVLNTNTRYLHENIVAYAERLLGLFPDPLNVVFFVCSGSEANELALRLARTYTGRRDIINLDAAYHGNTQALVDISPYKHAGPGGQGAPGWAHTALMPDPYRGRYRGYGADAGVAYAADVKRLIDEGRETGHKVAAFIAESVLGCGGQIVLPDNYLAAAYDHVRSAGGITIADEVQVGFGRVGSHFWGFETQGVVPDIVTLGKPIGNGHPLGAVVTTSAIADVFANGMEYFNTFGGNPVSCAIGMAVLDVIEEETLQAHAAEVGRAFLAGLAALQREHALIVDVRGLGLFVGVELVLDRETLEPAGEHASYIANRMRDHGIFISTDGPLHNVLKLKPPMPFSQTDADRVLEILGNILREDALRVDH